MQERIAELESQMAFQEHTVQELNDVIIELRNEIDGLRTEIDRMKDKIADIDTPTMIPQSEEPPPPHY